MAKKNTPLAVKRAGTGSDGALSKSQQRALRAEQQKAELAARSRVQNRRRSLLVSGAVVVLVALVAVLVVVGKHAGGGGATAEPSQYWLNVGNPKAPHQMVIYEDYLCPYCDHMEAKSGTQLQAAAKAGKVYISYRPFNLLAQDGPYSERALNAFLAVKQYAGDDAALKFHNELYQQQPAEPGPQDADSDDLIAMANDVVPKADQAKVADAIKGNKYKSAVSTITSYVLNTKHVQGTPTVYLDGKPFTDQSGSNTDPTFGASENLGDNMVKAVQ